MDASTLKPFLEHLAEISSREILPLFQSPDLHVELKEDRSPVTLADQRAEEVLRKAILAEFPDHGILGEEFGTVESKGPWQWILDPIDGTRSFAAGCPLFGTLVALAHDGRPVWGLIHLPAMNRCYIGNGEQTWRNGQIVRVPEPPELADCFLLDTDPQMPTRPGQSREGWESLVRATAQWRSWGDCFGYTRIVDGGAHIMCDPILNTWDLAALIPVLTGAGAEVSEWSGKPISADSASIVACAPGLQEAVIRLLNPDRVPV